MLISDGKLPQYASALCDQFHLETGVRVTCDGGYLCGNLSLSRAPCSRLRHDVRYRRQTDRRLTASSLNAPA